MDILSSITRLRTTGYRSRACANLLGVYLPSGSGWGWVDLLWPRPGRDGGRGWGVRRLALRGGRGQENLGAVRLGLNIVSIGSDCNININTTKVGDESSAWLTVHCSLSTHLSGSPLFPWPPWSAQSGPSRDSNSVHSESLRRSPDLTWVTSSSDR